MEENMKKGVYVHYSSEDDVLYIVSKRGEEEEFVEIAPGVNVELDEHKEVIGVEILNASKFLKPVVEPLYQKIKA